MLFIVSKIQLLESPGVTLCRTEYTTCAQRHYNPLRTQNTARGMRWSLPNENACQYLTPLCVQVTLMVKLIDDST